MKYVDKKTLNQEIEQLEQAMSVLSTTYADQDVELMILNRLLKKRGAKIRQSEIDIFKQHAISSLGTKHARMERR